MFSTPLSFASRHSDRMADFQRLSRRVRRIARTGLTLARGERGAAIVEMALVLPLLLAALDAIETDGSIGHVRISVRESVESANAMLVALLGVDLVAIRRVRFSALLPVGQRAAFVEARESVFRSGNPLRLSSQMVTRDGEVVDVTLTIAEVRGPYASEGAVILVTRGAD